MRVLLARWGIVPALLPYLHWPSSVHRGLSIATAAASPQQSRRPQLDVCRGYCRPPQYRVRGNDDEQKETVVVVMGATGTGKSKLSIELASVFSGEVVNSDKIQVYSGLDTTTNKMPLDERRGVPHHLLGELDPEAGELSPALFREMAASAIAEIAGRGRLPIMAGGSNSFIYAAMAGRYDPRWSPFEANWRRRIRREAGAALRHRCCFLWVDVDAEALAEYLDRRVEEMLAAGMVEELAQYFAAEAADEMGESRHPGLSKAIGVAEFQEYFRGEKRGTAAAYETAVAAIKANTRRLAEEQVRKIERLEEIGWPLRRLDATAAVAARLAGSAAEAEAAWERDVAAAATAAVERFLEEEIQVHQQRHIVRSPLHYT